MGTLTALHVQASDLATVQEKLSDWLQRIHGRGLVIERADSTFGVYNDAFILARGKDEFAEPPTILCLAQTQSDWLTIHHNSFHEMEEMAKVLSAHFSRYAVSLNAQTVTEAWCLGIYLAGQRVRKLYWVGESGEWLVQEGKPLSFETIPLGRNIGDEESPFHVFELDEVKDYCANLGLHIWDDAEIDHWTILRVL